MTDNRLLYSLQHLPNIDATLDEADSFSFLESYFKDNFSNYKYSYPDIYSLEEITYMVNNFSLFFGRIKDPSDNSIYSPVPINVFRYIMLEDMSYSSYYTVRRKSGYVVEGVYWSNGMFYSVRQDVQENYDIYQIVLSIDSYTKTLYQFP